MSPTLALVASLVVGLLVSSVAGDVGPDTPLGVEARSSTPYAQQRDLDRVFRKFLHGRISAKRAATRIADLLDRQGYGERRSNAGRLVVTTGEGRIVQGSEAIYGVLFQAETAEEERKIAELMEELGRILKIRAQFQATQ